METKKEFKTCVIRLKPGFIVNGQPSETIVLVCQTEYVSIALNMVGDLNFKEGDDLRFMIRSMDLYTDDVFSKIYPKYIRDAVMQNKTSAIVITVWDL